MNKYLPLLSLFLIFSHINTHAQINFEKGYFIDNSGQKTEGLIKNVDWNNNPTQFVYKLSPGDDPQKATIETVKEFGIYNSVKYVRSTVMIDRSSEIFSQLSADSEPDFEERQLFLKVLIEGKANLYEYGGNKKKFFYKKDDLPVEQLIFKTYKSPEGTVLKNKRFLQQLKENMDCTTITSQLVENLEYNKKNLKDFFVTYNECQNIPYKNYDEKPNKIVFGLSIRPRLNYSSLKVENLVTPMRNTDFGDKFNFGIGLEAEFIMPFNKNKWGIIFEPTYQQYESSKITEAESGSGRTLTAIADYRSIEIPLGVRHYFFLGEDSRLFINASYLMDINFDSTITYNRPDGTTFNSVEIRKRNNLAFGAGFKYQKYHLELRYQPSANVFKNYLSWHSEYKTASVILGYSFL